jgi:hypothetical protein
MSRSDRVKTYPNWRHEMHVAIAVVAIAAVARADGYVDHAPADQYSLFDASDLVIYDEFTKLTWERWPAGPTLKFAPAAVHCATLSLAIPGKVGTNGWRLPSYKELLTLVDEMPHPEVHDTVVLWTAIDPNAFPGTVDPNVSPGTVDQPYWTSSMVPGGSEAYFVEFQRGTGRTRSTNETLYVRCVHD